MAPPCCRQVNLNLPVPLAERLRETIRREGAITFHEWMKAALYDPEGGYYRRPDLARWGREADYRTSPERSDLFAATFARYFAKLYEDLDRPGDWTIVEGGAGDGRFALGVLRTLSDRFPAVFEATRYAVYDSSDDALARARERLKGFGERVTFYSAFELLPRGRGIYFSNELLDAFPVHRVILGAEGLSELYVTVGANGEFEWTTGQMSAPQLAEFCAVYAPDLEQGQIIEINLEIDEWLSNVVRQLDDGFIVTVDYGAEGGELYDPQQRPNGTLRGFSRHGFVDDVLVHPGECDITSSINWTQVKRNGEALGLKVVEFSGQDQFLLNAGLLEEMQYLLSKAGTEAEKLSLTTGAREMILPGGMASSFQVLVQQKVCGP
jgi:SAM-dependent MidA family methyltransferase